MYAHLINIDFWFPVKSPVHRLRTRRYWRSNSHFIFSNLASVLSLLNTRTQKSWSQIRRIVISRCGSAWAIQKDLTTDCRSPKMWAGWEGGGKKLSRLKRLGGEIGSDTVAVLVTAITHAEMPFPIRSLPPPVLIQARSDIIEKEPMTSKNPQQADSLPLT